MNMHSSLASNLSAIFIVAASYAACDRLLLLTFFAISVTLRGCLYSSLNVNPMDISPNHSGAIASVANGISAAVGFLVPYIIGVLTPNVSQLYFSIWRYFLSWYFTVFAEWMASRILDNRNFWFIEIVHILILGIWRGTTMEWCRNHQEYFVVGNLNVFIWINTWNWSEV